MYIKKMELNITFTKLRDPHPLDAFDPTAAGQSIHAAIQSYVCELATPELKDKIFYDIHEFLEHEYLITRREIYKIIAEPEKGFLWITTPRTLQPTYLLAVEYTGEQRAVMDYHKQDSDLMREIIERRRRILAAE